MALTDRSHNESDIDQTGRRFLPSINAGSFEFPFCCWAEAAYQMVSFCFSTYHRNVLREIKKVNGYM